MECDVQGVAAEMMRHLDLFSGIGGFSLGLESTGHYRTVAFCEIEDYPRRVLKKHWPEVICYDDIRELKAERLAADGIGRVDIVTGGFPCQDISLAGARAGLSGERSGLWSELFRVVTEVRPRWVIAENVPGLRTLGADRVLADLAGAGYAAWPLVVGAVHARAPHRRQRVWIVANAIDRRDGRWKQQQESGEETRQLHRSVIAHSNRGNAKCGHVKAAGRVVADVADTDSKRRERQGLPVQRRRQEQAGADIVRSGGGGECAGRVVADVADTDSTRLEKHAGERVDARAQQPAAVGGGWHAGWDWRRAPEPVLRRVDDGLPCGMDRRARLKALGNAVVPQIVAEIGKAIFKITAREEKEMYGKSKNGIQVT